MTDHLPTAFRALWHELPLLATTGALICTASAVVLLLSPGLSPPSVLLAAFAIAPVWAAAIATTDAVVREDRGGVVLLLKNLRKHAPAGLEVGVVPAVVIALALLNWQLYSGPLFALPWQSAAVQACFYYSPPATPSACVSPQGCVARHSGSPRSTWSPTPLWSHSAYSHSFS